MTPLADEVVPTVMDAILAGMTTITTLVGDIFTLMTSNAYLTVFFAAGLITVGIGVFAALRNAARG